MKHEWICDDCGNVIPFREPELPDNDPRSEMNESARCPRCGEEIYFCEVPAAGTLVTPTALPAAESITWN